MTKKQQRRNSLIIGGVTLASLLFFTERVFAVEQNTNEKKEVNVTNENFYPQVKLGSENTILNPGEIFKKSLNELGRSMVTNQPYQRFYLGFLDIQDSLYSNLVVEKDGEPTIDGESLLFVGEAVLTNNLDTEQTLKTNSFSKTVVNSVSSQVTNGFKLGTEAKASFGIPLIGSTEITMKAEYDYSSTETNETSESYTYGVVPQDIVVPPHSSVKVSVSLNTANISGNVKLLATPELEFTVVDGDYLYGPSPSNITEAIPFFEDWYTLALKSTELNLPMEGFRFNYEEDNAQLVGSGNYEAKYGTTFTVEVGPANKTIDGPHYSYEVKPTIVKK